MRYKTARDIVNRAYQSRPDDVVGKMTIRRLDDDLLALEAEDGNLPPLAGGGLRPWRKRLT